MLHPGRLTVGTYKSPIWKGISSEPNLHEDYVPAVNLPGCIIFLLDVRTDFFCDHFVREFQGVHDNYPYLVQGSVIGIL